MKVSAPLTALVPFGVVTVTSTAPAACAGEVTVIEVALTTAKLAAAVPPVRLFLTSVSLYPLAAAG